MAFSREDAYDALELPVGADHDSVRTSYKRLALRWHPEKHNHSHESKQKFHSISLAYKKLSKDDSDDDSDSDMAMSEMLHLFQDVFFFKPAGAYNGFDSSNDDDSDDEDDDDDDDDDDAHYSSILPDRGKISHNTKKSKDKPQKLTDEEINKNAQELISEEEKEKRRAEKRRAKKKRRRERKKLEKQGQQKPEEKKSSQKQKGDNTDSKGKSNKKDKKPTESSSDEDDFDPTSAFFTKVVNKKKKGVGSESSAGSKREKLKAKQQNQGGKLNDDESEDLDPVVMRSRQLAIRGNEMAQLGHYSAAIDLFTEAIKLDPSDFRFFGNRSYCFDRIQQYDKALRDAEKAILLSPDWPKGYFRKGRALAGLKLNSDAEQAFMQVLKLDKNCEDAMQELLRVRTQQLIEMGFSRQQAEVALKQHGTVQTALDSLLSGVAENSLSGEVYVSDDEDAGHHLHTHTHQTAPPPARQQQMIPHVQTTPDSKMDPCNPEGLTALWVGNVLPEVSDKKLSQMFARYGEVTSVRCLPDKFCAFVNFKHKESAGRAMHGLQGVECGGQRLLIKFPDNPIVSGGEVNSATTTSTVLLRQQNLTESSCAAATTSASNSKPPAPALGVKNIPKQSGPVNGDECYFWRTTGCQFGDKCRYKHIPSHKGLDRKPWQKVK